MEFKHTSVLLDETIENLNIRPDGVYMDGTLGGAGHSREIAKRLGSDGHLIGIDQDGEAIATAKERLAEYGDRITVVRDNYQNFKSILDELNILQVDGILLDLGVSSYQLDNADRGFTYRVDAPLDMRKDCKGYRKWIYRAGTLSYTQRIWRRTICKKYCIPYCEVS